MDLILIIILLIAGGFALVKGELKLSQKNISKGVPARIAGGLLVAAFPISLVVNIGYHVMTNLTGKSILGETAEGLLTYGVIGILVVMAVLVARKGLVTA